MSRPNPLTEGNSTLHRSHAYLHCTTDVIVTGEGENKSLPASVRPFLRNWVILRVHAFQHGRGKNVPLL